MDMGKSTLGYRLGYLGQGCSYMFISTYALLYMTNIVGLASSVASFIVSVALLVEVAAGMIIGNISDSFQSVMGKRRPFILVAAVTMPFILSGLFTALSGPANVKILYYLVFNILFRISFVCFEIVAAAFGAEIVRGYDERIKLRTGARTFSILGNLVAYVVPLWIISFIGDNKSGWLITGIFMGLFTFAAFFICFRLTAPFSSCGKIIKNDTVRKGAFASIVKNYRELIRLKTMKILIVYKAGFACAFALFSVGTIYYMRYSLGLSAVYTSYMYFYAVFIFLVSTPLINIIALKIGKSRQQKIQLYISGTAGLFVFIAGAGKIIPAIIYLTVFSIMQTSFWQLSGSIFYDIAEVDEFANGKRREGDIMSLVSVLGTMVTAVIVQLFGFMLALSGYDPALAVQKEAVSGFLNIAFVLVPSICMWIAGIALSAFPINKQNFAVLLEAIQLKNEGKDYSEHMSALKTIL